MRRTAAITVALLLASTPSLSQTTTFNDLSSYCNAMSQASSPTLLVRIQGVPRSKAEALMQGMTDPASIRMVKEVLNFAYSQPEGVSIDAMRAGLRKQCLAKKIFAQ